VSATNACLHIVESSSNRTSFMNTLRVGIRGPGKVDT
jgi:hypothetical protein